MNKRPYGIVFGRFQPLHIGHMEYLNAAHDLCGRLVIGVTNPNIDELSFHQADPKRSAQENNPYSYFVRYEMIDASLREEGWLPGSYAIVPADINDEKKINAFLPIPSQSTVFITIYDAWGEEKARRLEAQGYAVEVLWRREMSERVTSGTEIRTLIRQGEPWGHLVPGPVAEYVESRFVANEGGNLSKGDGRGG